MFEIVNTLQIVVVVAYAIVVNIYFLGRTKLHTMKCGRMEL
jgi:hypothetical protein